MVGIKQSKISLRISETSDGSKSNVASLASRSVRGRRAMDFELVSGARGNNRQLLSGNIFQNDENINSARDPFGGVL